MTVELVTVICGTCGHAHVATLVAAGRTVCPFCGHRLPDRAIHAYTEQPSERELREHATARPEAA